MAKRRGDVRSRSDVQDQVKQHEDVLRELGEEQEKVVDDAETVRETLDELDLAGTADGADQIEQAIESAEDVTVEVYDRRDQEVEEAQSETEGLEQELQERSKATESDLGKVSDASGRLTTQETSNELIKAKEAAIEDIEFLNENDQKAQEVRQESDRVRQEQRARIGARRR
jgi:PBP1b-binding outer membrane lipoprotein LpoB